MVRHYTSLISRFAATATILLAIANTTFGIGNDEFEEDPSIPQDDTIDWPEVEFPKSEERGAGFRTGETFQYRAQWGIFRNAGKIVIETAPELQNGSETLEVRTTTASSGLIRKIYPMTLNATATIDTEDWRLERNEVDGKTRSELNTTLTVVDYEEKKLTFEDRALPERNKVRSLPYEFPLDYSGALLQLRGYDLKIGEEYPVFVTTKGKFYLVFMKVMEIEEQRTKFGNRDCFRIEPVRAVPESKLFREGGKMAIWVSNDKERLPVRFDVVTKIGKASIRLDEHESDNTTEVARK